MARTHRPDRGDRPPRAAEFPVTEKLPEPLTRTEQVYDAVLEQIYSGELVPGSPLRQEELADRLGVSRYPVQQALMLLRDHGLLREHGRRGVEVAPLDESVVQDIYGLGAVLDGYTARLAAERRAAPWLLEAGRAVDDLDAAARARRPDLVVAADHAFRLLLTDAADSAVLTEASATAWRSRPRMMRLVTRSAPLPSWFFAGIRAILSCIRDRQGEEAEQRAVEQARRTGALVLEALGDVPERSPHEA